MLQRVKGQQSSKYGFERMEVGVPMVFPWFKKDDGTLDHQLNEKRAVALSQYMSRHGYTYLDLSTWKEGMIIQRRS